MCTLGPFRELAVKSVGTPDAGNPHVRFDERGGETTGCQSVPVQRPSSTLLCGLYTLKPIALRFCVLSGDENQFEVRRNHLLLERLRRSAKDVPFQRPFQNSRYRVLTGLHGSLLQSPTRWSRFKEYSCDHGGWWSRRSAIFPFGQAHPGRRGTSYPRSSCNKSASARHRRILIPAGKWAQIGRLCRASGRYLLPILRNRFFPDAPLDQAQSNMQQSRGHLQAIKQQRGRLRCGT
jgi:hypothetical protein